MSIVLPCPTALNIQSPFSVFLIEPNKTYNWHRDAFRYVALNCLLTHDDLDYTTVFCTDLDNFNNYYSNVPIVCQEHGIFYQRFGSHYLDGKGCPKCNYIRGDSTDRVSKFRKDKRRNPGLSSNSEPEVVFQSSLHHLYELLTIAPSLKNGALIGVDDNWVEQKDGNNYLVGKGQMVFDFMQKSGRPLVRDGYQLFWIW